MRMSSVHRNLSNCADCEVSNSPRPVLKMKKITAWFRKPKPPSTGVNTTSDTAEMTSVSGSVLNLDASMESGPGPSQPKDYDSSSEEEGGEMREGGEEEEDEDSPAES